MSRRNIIKIISIFLLSFNSIEARDLPVISKVEVGMFHNGTVWWKEIDPTTGTTEPRNGSKCILRLTFGNYNNATIELPDVSTSFVKHLVNGNFFMDNVFCWLVGDVNDDGSTNLIDMAFVKSKNGQTITSDNAHFDINLDGSINLIDMALVKSLNGNSCLIFGDEEFGSWPVLSQVLIYIEHGEAGYWWIEAAADGSTTIDPRNPSPACGQYQLNFSGGPGWAGIGPKTIVEIEAELTNIDLDYQNLPGDANRNGSVDGSDVNTVQAAEGQALDSMNFYLDIDCDGDIDEDDTAMVSNLIIGK